MSPTRRGLFAAALVMLIGLTLGVAGAGFDDDFTGATLRVDYDHTGIAAQEHIALERVRVEGHDRARGWGYHLPAASTGSMTAAGVSSVAICRAELDCLVAREAAHDPKA